MSRSLRITGTALGLLAALTVALVMARPAPVAVAADPTQEKQGIEAVGEGIAETRPDAARVTVGVWREAVQAQAAYAEAARAMNSILSALRAKGLGEDALRTSSLSLQPNYVWNKDQNRQELKGYRAQASITATTRNLDQVGALVDAAVAAGANTVQGVEFFVWDPQARQAEALDRAVDAARAKANRVATRLGVKVGAPLQVTITDEGTPPPVLFRQSLAAAEAAPAPSPPEMPVLPGTTQIRVQVRVVFGIQ